MLRKQTQDQEQLSTQAHNAESIPFKFNSGQRLKQKFSVTSHPRLPILLCSDGYIVTALQITTVMTSHDVAASLLVEINKTMKIISDQFNLDVSIKSVNCLF